jgi:hypothetical protein
LLRYAPEKRSRSRVVAGKRATEELNTTTKLKKIKPETFHKLKPQKRAMD